MKADDFRSYLERRRGRLTEMRDVHNGVWKEVADHFCPEAGRLIGEEPSQHNRSRGGRVDQRIVNSHSRQVVQYISGGLHTGLTPQNQPWFRLGIANRSLGSLASVSNYLEGVREEITYQLGKSNFYVIAQQVYSDTPLFGQAPVIVTSPSDEKPLHFTLCAPGTYAIDTDHFGRVSTLLRTFTMSIAEAAEEFGEEALPASKRLLLGTERAYHEHITIYNLIEPNDQRTAGVEKLKGKPYRSIYWMKERDGRDDGVLAVRGFSYNPILCPRWMVYGADPYGVGPGLFALGDSKAVQAFEVDILRMLKKYVDPPITGPANMQDEDFRTYPGGVTLIPDASSTNGGTRPPIGLLYPVQPDFPALRGEAKAIEQRMDELFFVNLFMSILAQPMRAGTTAREVAERHEEKLMLLAPVLNRMHGEFLAPVIDVAYAALSDRFFFDDAPMELVGEAFDVEYMSILIQAQKLVGMRGVQEFYGFAAQIDGIEPGTLRKLVDTRQIMRTAAGAFGLPKDALRDEKAVAAMDKAEAEQAAQAQQMQQAAEMAEMVKDVSSVPTGEGSLFQSVANGTGVA